MERCRDNRCSVCGDPWTGGLLPEGVDPDPYGPYDYLGRYDDPDLYWPLWSTGARGTA